MNVYCGQLSILFLGLLISGCVVEPVVLPDPVDRTGSDVKVSYRGREVAFTGEQLVVGAEAPDVTLISRRGDQVRLSDFRGKVLLLSVVPELGTAVCDRTTQMLEDSELNRIEDVVMFTISTDTWGEQAGWAKAMTIRRHMTLSDALDPDFGRAYGLLIKETGDLGRCVLVIDKAGVIRRIENQTDMARMPDIPAAERFARTLAEAP